MSSLSKHQQIEMVLEIVGLYGEKCNNYAACIEEIVVFAKKHPTNEMFSIIDIIEKYLNKIELITKEQNKLMEK